MSLLDVRNLTVHFPVKQGLWRRHEFVRAVDGVSFTLNPGETIGLVGESGCGKTTLGRAVIRLIEPTSGQVLLHDQDITLLKSTALRSCRRKFQMIFQDPIGSLDPRMTVENCIGKALDIHRLTPMATVRRQRVEELLQQVGLEPAHARRWRSSRK
jgi:peptide/nickel transport system ATP-binding protein